MMLLHLKIFKNPLNLFLFASYNDASELHLETIPYKKWAISSKSSATCQELLLWLKEHHLHQVFQTALRGGWVGVGWGVGGD